MPLKPHGLFPKGTRVLGRYVVERLIGEGGMGQVYLGRHEGLGFPVALKMLIGGEPSLEARFEREAHLMARVRHPNVVTVLDYGMTPVGIPCIAMEYIDGESVTGRLNRVGPLEWRDAARLAIGIFQGLQAMHALSVLHRDLKPSNVLIAPGEPETAKLIDFGLSRPANPDATRYTCEGYVVGTPAFVAPELWLGATADGRSDLYAAGLILYDLVTGIVPFSEDRLPDRRTTVPVPRPKAPSMRPTLPEPFIAFLMSILEIDPAKRPQSAAEAAKRLAAILDADVARADPRRVASRPVTVATPVPPTMAPSPRQTPLSTTPTPLSPRSQDVTVIERRRTFGRLPLIVAATLPPSRLQSPEDLGWLRTRVVPGGRTLLVGATFWFAIVPVADAAAGEETGARIRDMILSRYRNMARVVWQLAEEGFAVQESAGTSTPLPPEFQELIDRLFG